MASKTALLLEIPGTELRNFGSGLRILLTDSKRWAVGPRIGKAFAALGCEVAMLCPREGHPAYTLSAIKRKYVNHGLDPVDSLRRTIEDFDPHLVLPTCDRGVSYLHRLHQKAEKRGDRAISACIERSLGPASSFPVVSSRYHLLMQAEADGIAIPETVALGNADDLRSAIRLGLPLAIKADGTWGGCGVMTASTQSEAFQAFRQLSARQGIPWLMKEITLNRDRATILDDWRHRRPSLIAQKWIDGQPANCAVACWEGKILAGVAVKVLVTTGERGPASLVEVVQGVEMLRAAERIARRLKLSGFFGLDFMVERHSGIPFLIEMNPRCTQAAMLLLGTGRHLPAAICAAMTGKPEPATEPVTKLRRIAYFPKPAHLPDPDLRAPEWRYHYDLPADEPEFVQQMLNQWDDRSRLGRWLDRTRRANTGLRARALHPAEQP